MKDLLNVIRRDLDSCNNLSEFYLKLLSSKQQQDTEFTEWLLEKALPSDTAPPTEKVNLFEEETPQQALQKKITTKSAFPINLVLQIERRKTIFVPTVNGQPRSLEAADEQKPQTRDSDFAQELSSLKGRLTRRNQEASGEALKEHALKEIPKGLRQDKTGHYSRKISELQKLMRSQDLKDQPETLKKIILLETELKKVQETMTEDTIRKELENFLDRMPEEFLDQPSFGQMNYIKKHTPVEIGERVSVDLMVNGEKQTREYEAVATTLHHGTSANGGHYTALRKEDNAWYHYNDSTRDRVDDNDVNQVGIGEKVTMIIYQLVEEPSQTS
jgi:hypothetical protein